MTEAKKKGQFNDLSRFCENFARVVWQFFRVVWIGAIQSSIPVKTLRFRINFYLVTILLAYWAHRPIYLWWLHKLNSDLFSIWLIQKVSAVSGFKHFLFLFIPTVLLYLFFKGRSICRVMKKAQNAFELAGLKNGKGNHPQVVKCKFINEHRYQIVVRADGVAKKDFEQRAENLVTGVGGLIDRIEEGLDPRYVIITVSTCAIPQKIEYDNVIDFVKTPYNFVVGQGLSGVIMQDLRELPHMMVVGTTGSGKSVFCNQLLMCLLENNPKTKFYLIDLKNGLELSDFAICPNVAVFKTIGDAERILEEIHVEMNTRFKLLEMTNDRILDQEKHQKDRIVVLIDEASVLYRASRIAKAENDLVKRASHLTDEIAKLGRVAGIHLIFALQKVIKGSLSTSIQENVEGRLCFKTNSFQGSNMVLGNGDAADLPDTRGRGIWKAGSKLELVQAPYISKEDVVSRCNAIAREFESGTRKIFSPHKIQPISKLQPSKKRLTKSIVEDTLS